MTPHVDLTLLQRHADRSLDDATRWSVEQHVSRCVACHQLAATVSVPDADVEQTLNAVWAEIALELDAREHRTSTDRLLARLGVREDLARLLAATPSLTVPWLLAVAATLAATVAIAWAAHDVSQARLAAPLLFLVIAPLLPIAAVGASFGPAADPAYDIALAAPLSAGRLLLVRTVAVLASSLPPAAVAAFALPGLGWSVVAWVIPALALTAVTLALSSWVSPPKACAAVALLWLGGVTCAEIMSDAPLAAFGASTQVLMFGATVAAALSVVQRLQEFETRAV